MAINPPGSTTIAILCAALLGLLVSFTASGSETPLLSLERADESWTITSRAGPTWRVVLATHSPASPQQPGGGVVRALHIPADHPTGVVGSEPRHFATGPWGLDELEWRYVVKGAQWGTRKALGLHSSISRIEVMHESADRIEIEIEGQWENVPRFIRRLTFDPGGWHIRVEADWDGPDTHYGMWWMWSLFRGTAMDHEHVLVEDGNSPAEPLPVFKGNVRRVPEAIDLPYTVSFPLNASPVPYLRLRVNEFGGDSKRGPCYELWPEEIAKHATDEKDTYKVFMPRWVAGGIARRTYVFDYEWRILAAP